MEPFRSRLLRREAEATKAIVRAYLEAAAAVRERIAALLSIGELSANQSIVLSRLRSFQQQLESEMRGFASEATGIVSDAQADAVALAGSQTAEVLAAFDRAPISHIQAIAGNFESGGLSALFDSIGPGLSAEARRILTGGIAQGLGASQVARHLRASLGIGLNRAMTISRTEIMRSYRDASLASYRAAGVTRYMWMASLSSRTCAMCLALHGKVFDTDEPFATHPRCRCTMTAVIDEAPKVESGAAWLAEQSESEQIAVVGRAGYAALQSGEISLSDFIGGVRPSPFGPSRSQQSLRAILGREQAMRFYKRAA